MLTARRLPGGHRWWTAILLVGLMVAAPGALEILLDVPDFEVGCTCDKVAPMVRAMISL